MVVRDLDDLFNGDVHRVHRDRLAVPRACLEIVLVDSVALPAPSNHFAFECIHGGQISAIGMLASSAAAYLHIARRPLAAGLVLSICTYKPTLLPIVLMLLLATRQSAARHRRVLPAADSSSRPSASFPWAQIAAVPMRKNLLAYASDTATPVNQAVFRTWKFIDLNAFLKLLASRRVLIAMVLFFCVVAIFRWVADASAIRRCEYPSAHLGGRVQRQTGTEHLRRDL